MKGPPEGTWKDRQLGLDVDFVVREPRGEIHQLTCKHPPGDPDHTEEHGNDQEHGRDSADPPLHSVTSGANRKVSRNSLGNEHVQPKKERQQ